MHWKRYLVVVTSLCMSAGVAEAQPAPPARTAGPPKNARPPQQAPKDRQAPKPEPPTFCSVVDKNDQEIDDVRWIALQKTLTLKPHDVKPGKEPDISKAPSVTCAHVTTPDNRTSISETSKNDKACGLSDPSKLEGQKFIHIEGLCVLITSGSMRTEYDRDMVPLTFKGDHVEIAEVAVDHLVLVVPEDKKPAKMMKLDELKAPFKGRVFWLDGPDLKAASIDVQSGTNSVPNTRTELREQADDDCKTAVRQDNRQSKVLCFSVSDSEVLPIDHGDPRLVIRPNTPVRVVVAYRTLAAGSHVAVSAEGQVGIFTPGTRNETPSVRADAGTNAPPPPPPFVQPLGPFLPGNVTVHVRVVPAGNATPIDLPTQLVVEETYSGALRLGIGGVFGGAVERGFALRSAPGSSQPEIVANNGGDMDAELVLGAAIFLERGGRGYVVPDHNGRLAPYVGIGILDQTENGLKVLRSVHLGLEYELNPHFSIAVTAVGRRITRLSGAKLGDPVAMGGALPTETGFAFGWAIVINLSPDFFKLATKSGSSFYAAR